MYLIFIFNKIFFIFLKYVDNLKGSFVDEQTEEGTSLFMTRYVCIQYVCYDIIMLMSLYYCALQAIKLRLHLIFFTLHLTLVLYRFHMDTVK